MHRLELEHAIRAATEIIRQDSVIIIGSQSILGTWTEEVLPEAATMSEEVDIAPIGDDDAETLATELDAAIGELSSFHETHGFYVQGVGRYTAVLPAGWEDWLVAVSNDNTRYRTGLCLDPHDLCVAKLVAAREKDYAFVSELVAAALIKIDILMDRANQLDSDDPRRKRVISWLESQLG